MIAEIEVIHSKNSYPLGFMVLPLFISDRHPLPFYMYEGSRDQLKILAPQDFKKPKLAGLKETQMHLNYSFS
jgi:hypothetical protein